MPAFLNKQPIFTGSPKLIVSQFDPEVPSTFKYPGLDKYTVIYEDVSTYGTLITKITVTATAVIGDIVTTKVIYLAIRNTDGLATLYQSKIMTGINGLTNVDIVPYVTFEFNGGLITSPNTGNRLCIAASTNRNNTGEDGDEISVVVEGGTYDDPTL